MLKERGKKTKKKRNVFTSSAGDTPTRQILLIILRASETFSDAARPRINDVYTRTSGLDHFHLSTRGPFSLTPAPEQVINAPS